MKDTFPTKELSIGLEGAVWCGFPAIVKMLIDAGADGDWAYYYARAQFQSSMGLDYEIPGPIEKSFLKHLPKKKHWPMHPPSFDDAFLLAKHLLVEKHEMKEAIEIALAEGWIPENPKKVKKIRMELEMGP